MPAARARLSLPAGDLGYEEQPKDVRAMTTNVTWLTYWGLYKDHPIGGWKAAHRPGKVGGRWRGEGEGRIG